MKILDSDHCVAILRGQLDLKDHIQPDEELAITTISVGELAYGAHKSKRAADNLARLDVLFSALTLLPYDDQAARRFGQLKAALEQGGERLSDLDVQIASIAIESQSPLVTHNRSHFARLMDMADLVLKDWL